MNIPYFSPPYYVNVVLFKNKKFNLISHNSANYYIMYVPVVRIGPGVSLVNNEINIHYMEGLACRKGGGGSGFSLHMVIRYIFIIYQICLNSMDRIRIRNSKSLDTE